MDKLVQRINELAKKKKEQGLTPDEHAEQKQLYSEYLKRFRMNFDKQLDNISVKNLDGSVVPFKQANKKNK